MGRSIRALANVNPDTRCWRCGLTLAEIHQTRPNVTWDAGHLVDGNLDAGLAAECSHCNRSAGARKANEEAARPEHDNALGL